eukprot:5768674-Karenia_brevis.AAC.1
MGPCAGDAQWPSVVKKGIERARVVASGGCASVLSAWTYNSKVVTVYSYKAALFDPPKEIRRTEMQMVAS